MSGNIQKSLTGLYRPEFEKDSCGFGLIANMDDESSHWLINTAVNSLCRLTHRGAVAADGKTGDGCGILIKKPDSFLRQVATENGVTLEQHYAVGMVFLNRDDAMARRAEAKLESELKAEGLKPAGWRDVPVNDDALGKEAKASQPYIRQIFVNCPPRMNKEHFELHLYLARRRTEKSLHKQDEVFYISSLSSTVLSYKGLVMPSFLGQFYLDLSNQALESSLAVFHQRFSTNTWPQWRLSQPFRYVAHNGEINTVQGNRNWSNARSFLFSSDRIPDMADIRPIVSHGDSDSCSLDNMLESMLMGGMDVFRAMRLLIPPAWENDTNMDPDLRAYYEYSGMNMEPWDGPAGIVLTDGRYGACCLDRNGLRPARYVVTKDRHMTIGSEIGIYDYAPEEVLTKGRLKPGQMLAVDTETGAILYPNDIDNVIKSRFPYRQWIDKNTVKLSPETSKQPLVENPMDSAQLNRYMKYFQVTFEERDQVLRVLAESGQEATGSMGDDTPLPVLSRHVRSLYDNFRQQFAQVTNPPIDSLRERIVMSLLTYIGGEGNLFSEGESHTCRVEIKSPILSQKKFTELLKLKGEFPHEVLPLNYSRNNNLKAAVIDVCDRAVAAARLGKCLLVLSDRTLQHDQLVVHALLATGAVHHRLIREGLRCDVNIIVETATARDAHQCAVLIGYGATAIYPYLAYETLNDMIQCHEIPDADPCQVGHAYRKGINKGLLKVLSKMGISSINSYRGAQLYEIVGLHDQIVDLCFTGTTSRIQGIRFEDLKQDSLILAKDAWNTRKPIQQGGLLKFVYGGEEHAYNPDVIKKMHMAVETGDYEKWKDYAAEVNNRPVLAIRDLLRLKKNRTAIALDQVEPIESILKRFDSAGMSLGALSPTAHEALAEAMNAIGGRSNSGEGGEDPKRYNTNKVSKIKQVASGRFGVTPHYLVNAEVIQIKVAQGAKPGEGGQLPGNKVNDMIATLRYSVPGVTLISPPPHHDIYSIEDLAQLIFDLKQINPKALISVKLVAEAGVGTIAAGVAKAYADLITIAGHDGGTGASPLTSVKYAGSPWELGLTETHQILRANDLRDKVRVQTDGGLKTGLDVIKAAILGAESFGFGTGPMIAMGCKYLRICHLNNCATGVATQDNVLYTDHFKPNAAQKVIHYFKFIAEDVRHLLADLGYPTVQELIGQTQLLQIIEGKTAKQTHLDLTPIISDYGVPHDKPQFCTADRNEPYDQGVLAETMVKACLPAIENKSGGEYHFNVQNLNRSIGARLSGEIARRYGNEGMVNQPITLKLSGTAGQSFGVWNAGGLNMLLEGDANDYVGKGMAGGQLAVFPPKASLFASQESVIMGNTCLYGATGGELYAAGKAGERFAVRNSGATAVVEGLGDHGCEYMTGGTIVVLGETGFNFGAGMTGGNAFIYDVRSNFDRLYNQELIQLHRITCSETVAYRDYLLQLIQKHIEVTRSQWADKLLHHFDDAINAFWLVLPKSVTLAKTPVIAKAIA